MKVEIVLTHILTLKQILNYHNKKEKRQYCFDDTCIYSIEQTAHISLQIGWSSQGPTFSLYVIKKVYHFYLLDLHIRCLDQFINSGIHCTCTVWVDMISDH